MKRVAHQVEAKKVEAKAQRMVAAQAKRDEKKAEAKTSLRPFDRIHCRMHPPEVAVQKINLRKPDPYEDGDLVCCRYMSRAFVPGTSRLSKARSYHKKIITKSQCLSGHGPGTTMECKMAYWGGGYKKVKILTGSKCYMTPTECSVRMWCEALARSTKSLKSKQ